MEKEIKRKRREEKMNTLLDGNGKKIKRKIRKNKMNSKEKLILLHKGSKLCDEPKKDLKVKEDLEAIALMIHIVENKNPPDIKIEETSEVQTPQLLIEKGGKIVEKEIIGLGAIKTRLQPYFAK